MPTATAYRGEGKGGRNACWVRKVSAILDWLGSGRLGSMQAWLPRPRVTPCAVTVGHIDTHAPPPLPLTQQPLTSLHTGREGVSCRSEVTEVMTPGADHAAVSTLQTSRGGGRPAGLGAAPRLGDTFPQKTNPKRDRGTEEKNPRIKEDKRTNM